jgi:hypothetical protein
VFVLYMAGLNYVQNEKKNSLYCDNTH